MLAMMLAAFVAATNFSGVVTFSREGDDYFFAMDDHGSPWRIGGARPGGLPSPGQRFRVRGQREPSTKQRLQAQRLELGSRTSPGADAPGLRRVSPAELYEAILPYGSPDWYGRTLAVEGTVIDINRRQKTVQLLVGESGCNFQVELPWDIETHLPKDLVLGTRVSVKGVLVYTSIENVSANRANRIENIELMPMSAKDVVIVKRAPFWNLARIGMLFGGVILLSAILLAWQMIRRRFERLEAEATRRERLRLAADLHDGFQQYLAGSMFRLQAAINLLPQSAAASRTQLEGVRDALQHTQNGLRSTLWAMTEESEGPQSVVELIRYAASRMAHWQGIVSVVCEGAERAVDRRIATSLLLIIQEAVGNAIRHGGASAVTVKVVFGAATPKGVLLLEIADNGRGFALTGEKPAGHYGLKTMERRVRELGGTMKVESAPGTGTRLQFSI